MPPLQSQEKQPSTPPEEGEQQPKSPEGEVQEQEQVQVQVQEGVQQQASSTAPVAAAANAEIITGPVHGGASGDVVNVNGEIDMTNTTNSLEAPPPQLTIPEAETTTTSVVPEIATTTTAPPSVEPIDRPSNNPLPSDPLPTDLPTSDPTVTLTTTSETIAATVVDIDGLFSDSVSDVGEVPTGIEAVAMVGGDGDVAAAAAGAAAGSSGVASQESTSVGPLVGAPPLVPPPVIDNTTTAAAAAVTSTTDTTQEQVQGAVQQPEQSTTDAPVTSTKSTPGGKEGGANVSLPPLPLANDGANVAGGGAAPPQLPLSMQDQVALLLTQKPNPFLDLPPPDSYSNPASPRTLEGTSTLLNPIIS